MRYKALTKAELVSVIEGRGSAGRIPVLLHCWVHQDQFPEELREEVNGILAAYPEDAQIINIRMPQVFKNPQNGTGFSWVNYPDPYDGLDTPLDARIAINDWEELDNVLAEFPNPGHTAMFPHNPESDGRYRLGNWWYCLFERHWSLRGMTNALMDFYTDPESVHRLYSALTDFYLATMKRAKRDLDIDGVWTSDDLGTQNGPFFRRRFFASSLSLIIRS